MNDGTPITIPVSADGVWPVVGEKLIPAGGYHVSFNNLPAAFVAPIRPGWWTTCLEILPAKERARGRF